MKPAYTGFQAYASFNALVVVQSSAATPIGYNTQNVEYLPSEQNQWICTSAKGESMARRQASSMHKMNNG
jgi:hypothetical protein